MRKFHDSGIAEALYNPSDILSQLILYSEEDIYMKQVDVLIVGGGVIGAAAARALARYKIGVALVEAESDLARGTSGANSGIVHAGYDAKPGTLMAELNVKGNAMYPELCSRLSIPFEPIGSLVLAFSDEDKAEIQRLYRRGLANGVPGLRVISADEVKSMEPNVSENVNGALYAPTAGVISPYEATIAFAENAAENGVDFYLRHPVTRIEKKDGLFYVTAGETLFVSKLLINCAGTRADAVSQMAGGEAFPAKARKGEYILYDKNMGGYVNHVLFQPPGKMGKGILVTQTAEGNLLIGPSSVDVEDPEDTATTQDGLDMVLNTARKTCPGLPGAGAITTFAGMRSVIGDDFILRYSDQVDGLLETAGICSPGLTAAPAIAEKLVSMVGEKLDLTEKEDFKDTREGIPHFAKLSWEERGRLIEQDPAYARMVCRCETVTEGQILKALRSPIPVYTLDGVKRRCRAGMGRCQGSFCTPRVMEIIERETGIPIEEITKSGPASPLVMGHLKDAIGEEENA